MEEPMKHVWLGLFILLILTSPTFAQDEVADNSTVILANAETAETQNTNAVTDVPKTPLVSEKPIKTRSKWDFSDHSEDKKKDQSKKDQNSKKNGYTKSQEQWLMNNNKQTWKSPVSEKIQSSNYSKSKP